MAYRFLEFYYLVIFTMMVMVVEWKYLVFSLWLPRKVTDSV